MQGKQQANLQVEIDRWQDMSSRRTMTARPLINVYIGKTRRTRLENNVNYLIHRSGWVQVNSTEHLFQIERIEHLSYSLTSIASKDVD
jgi:hypothetical protein